MDVEALKRSLPRSLENRFTSLSTYVKSIIEIEQQENKKYKDLSDAQINLIQFLVFVYSLDGFLRTGTAAAKNASIIFKQYQGEGFRIGSKVFTEDNENTLLGDELANNLREAIKQFGLDEILQNSSSIRELIIKIIGGGSNG